jgi:hypothetical protein
VSAVPEGLGSAAEEAARLAEALGGWFTSATGPSAVRDDAPPDADPPNDPAHDPATCRACPLCRGVALVRSVNPEVVEHLTAAAGSLAAALRELRAPHGPREEEPA